MHTGETKVICGGRSDGFAASVRVHKGGPHTGSLCLSVSQSISQPLSLCVSPSVSVSISLSLPLCLCLSPSCGSPAPMKPCHELPYECPTWLGTECPATSQVSKQTQTLGPGRHTGYTS